MSLSGRDGARRGGGHRIKNRCDLTEDYVGKKQQKQKGQAVMSSFTPTRHTLQESAHVGASPRTTFPRSEVLSLEITPCTAACVPVPAVLVVCPPAGVCSRCSNTWSEVLDVTGVNKAWCEQCARLPPFSLLSCHRFKLALTPLFGFSWFRREHTHTLRSSGEVCVRAGFW